MAGRCTDKEPYKLSLAEAAAGIAAGRLSSVALTEAVLRRIESFKSFNAFVTVTAELALKQAARVERLIASGAIVTPLAGVPLALKDNIPLAGIRTTACSNLLRNWVPAQSAEVATALEIAGGVIVGKTTLWELAYGASNPAFGDAVNPWAAERSAGPSSSGSAVAVSLGLCYAALGTDTGGSVRIPAAYCGVVGFKPTLGLIPTGGVVPTSHTLDHIGLLARTVEDTALVIEGLLARPILASGLKPERPHGMRVAVPVGESLSLGRDQRSGLERAIAVLRSEGVVVEETETPSFNEACEVKWAISSPEAAAAHRQLIAGRETQLQPAVRRLLATGAEAAAIDYIRALRRRDELIRVYEAALEGFDALLTPTVPSAAPVSSDVEDGDLAAMTRFTSLFNVVGAPAVAVPAGLAETALPLSIQFAGRAGADAEVLAIAAAYERARGPADVPPPSG